GCGDCVTSCLFKAIVRVLGAGCATHARIIDSRCTGCGVCQLECDKDAIELVDAPTDEPG
ncbi:MAG: 4Fe-4S binding protein, partial [Deltaproteobacteria bacterium]